MVGTCHASSNPLLTNIVPFLVWGFFKLITPFIDPMTKEKLKFNDDMRQYVPPEQLWNEFHGDLEFDYDHDVYWPALTQRCAEIRAAQKERWIKGGKVYGESEAYLKGADVPSVGQASLKTEEVIQAPIQAEDIDSKAQTGSKDVPTNVVKDEVKA